jgi:hypothetical protein
MFREASRLSKKPSIKIREIKLMKCRASLSLNFVYGPSRLCLCRCAVFHRFDCAAQSLDATTLLQPIKADSLARIDFSLFFIDALFALMHRS